jgi:predicted GIY-YIG superfamily endonuclease
MLREHGYFVYIVSSKSRTLYIGVTNHLLERGNNTAAVRTKGSQRSTKFIGSSTSNAFSTSVMP